MAGSPNAFANVPSARAPPPGVLAEQDHNARAPKRARLSEDAVASIQIQCAKPDTSLEVDHMILDYIAYQTTNACFASRNLDGSSSSPYSLSSNLAMSNAFLSIFKARHPTYKPDAELRLRILLLKLATLFTQRLTSNPTTPPHSDLLNLRAANKERSRTWSDATGFAPSWGSDSIVLEWTLPIPLQTLETNRAHALHELGIPAEDEDYEDAFYGTSSCVSLLDILPLFMELSAARNAMNSGNINEGWMQLACEFMLQACLEQYLIFGASKSDTMDEAFAWGYMDMERDVMAVDGEDGKTFGDKNAEINAMFEDEDYATGVDGWSDMKMSYINELMAWTETAPTSIDNRGPDEDDIIPCLQRVAEQHPIAAFESTLLEFLEAISKSLPDPLLIQLENGKLDGMTEQQTHEFLAECGVGVAKFFDPPGG